jgi:hypothetical protein
MKPYQNLSGESGIALYEAGEDWIAVLFTDGSEYMYTYGTAGQRQVERMKVLAEAGQGLNTYINEHVREHFARKLARKAG